MHDFGATAMPEYDPDCNLVAYNHASGESYRFTFAVAKVELLTGPGNYAEVIPGTPTWNAALAALRTAPVPPMLQRSIPLRDMHHRATPHPDTVQED
jgi:hypothetical protein